MGMGVEVGWVMLVRAETQSTRRFKILPRRGNAISQFAGGKLTDQLTMRSMVEGERGRARS